MTAPCAGISRTNRPIFPTHISAREWIAAMIAGFVIWVISDFRSYLQVINAGKG
jgi:hypothetical protein